MLLVSFGSPSAIGYAVTHIARAALEGCIGEHALFQVVSLDDFKAKWQASAEDKRRAVLVVSDCPHAEVVGLFSAARGPIVVSCDSFDHIVGYVMRARGMEFAPAVRFATQVLCALETLADAPNVMRVTSDDYGRSLQAVASALVDFTGLPTTDAQFGTVMARLLGEEGRRDEGFRDFVERHFPHVNEGEGSIPLSAGEADTLTRLCDDYGPLTRAHPLDAARWPTALFLDWDRPGRFLSGPVSLLGPARFIVCGPYLHLPRGRWRMSVEIEVEDCLSDNRLGADVFSGRILAAATMRLPARGARGFDLDFEVADPLLPVELRMQLLTGAIEGSLRLLDVRLSRTPRPDVHEDL